MLSVLQAVKLMGDALLCCLSVAYLVLNDANKMLWPGCGEGLRVSGFSAASWRN
jgi:hypothetical protein